MNMKVRDRLPAISPIIDYQAKSRILQTFRLRDLSRNKQQVAKQLFIILRGHGDPRNLLFGNDNDVCRSLQFDVVKRQAEIVLMHDAGGNFPGKNSGENVGHKRTLAAG